jgi:FKBP-type peptidyl-prolyl cis-trans isomerase
MSLIAGISFSAWAQKPQPAKPAPKPVTIAPAAPAPAAAPPKPFNFKRLKSGLEYAFIIDKPTTQKPKEGDLIRVNMISVGANRIIYSSAQANKNKPAEFNITKPGFNGDIVEAIMYMSVGDSMVAQVDAQTIFKNTKNKMPDFMKAGDKMQYYIKLVSIKTKEELMKEQQAKMQKQIQEQMAKQQKDQKKIALTDEKKLQAFFKEKNITPTKTASGMYYMITQNGSGESPKMGDKVKMNYTGVLLDGTKFDSNVDTAFGHTNPFEFNLGKGMVIKGWDEGVALLKKGSKAILYIPSGLAYGGNARPGGGANPKGIPANSCLVFEVELLDFETPLSDDQLLQNYFKQKNISPTKTASGMYYTISSPGEGPTAQKGEEVSMNYSGFLLDGTKFDSNTDSAFQHVSPFGFVLGQGQVIKGWDEGVALLNKGAKATFYIPSTLAYGPRAMPGGGANPKGIPANSCLVFDVELNEIKKK